MQRFLQGDQVETDVVELARRTLIDGHVLELEDHVQLAAGRIGVEPRLFGCHRRHLADRHELAVAAGEDLAGHLGEVVVHVRSVGEPVDGDDEPLPRDRRCVGEPVGLGDEIDDVHAEAVDTAVEPPAHDVVHRAPYLRVLPVQVGLLPVEQVQVVLARWSDPIPTPSRRRTSPSCSARRRHGRRARCTSPASGCRATTATRRTTGAHRRCG